MNSMSTNLAQVLARSGCRGSLLARRFAAFASGRLLVPGVLRRSFRGGVCVSVGVRVASSSRRRSSWQSAFFSSVSSPLSLSQPLSLSLSLSLSFVFTSSFKKE